MAEGSFGEWHAPREYWNLKTSDVWRGHDVVRGNRETVLLLPGLFGNDLYLHSARDWLGRIGYLPLLSSLAWNAGCSRRLLDQVESAFAQKVPEQNADIAIIGHSRGGLLAKAFAARLGARVSRLIVVGSPLGGMLRAGREGFSQFTGNPGPDQSMARRSVVQAGRSITRLLDPDCDPPECGCDYIDALVAPVPDGLAVTSIYSRTDTIVPPQASVIDGAVNIEVSGTHSGLMFNREVYSHLANALALDR